MKLMERIKDFWKENKRSYLWSCLALFLLGSFIGVIKDLDMASVYFFILISFPSMLILSFGVCELSRGDK